MQQQTAETTMDRIHPTIDLTHIGQSIHDLHETICRHSKRVEVTRAGCDDRCVLISKTELEGLEKAVQMFADTKAFADMSQNIQQLLRAAGLVYEQPA